jgi:hypothetical protein
LQFILFSKQLGDPASHFSPDRRDLRRFNHNHPESAIAAAHIYTSKPGKEKLGERSRHMTFA